MALGRWPFPASRLHTPFIWFSPLSPHHLISQLCSLLSLSPRTSPSVWVRGPGLAPSSCSHSRRLNLPQPKTPTRRISPSPHCFALMSVHACPRVSVYRCVCVCVSVCVEYSWPPTPRTGRPPESGPGSSLLYPTDSCPRCKAPFAPLFPRPGGIRVRGDEAPWGLRWRAVSGWCPHMSRWLGAAGPSRRQAQGQRCWAGRLSAPRHKDMHLAYTLHNMHVGHTCLLHIDTHPCTLTRHTNTPHAQT